MPWGWQFNEGVSLDRAAGRAGGGSLRIRTKTGDYARFFVFNSRAGARSTLSGWMKTASVQAAVPGGGAFYAAQQFELQGRPAQFGSPGASDEQRQGNLAGDRASVRWPNLPVIES